MCVTNHLPYDQGGQLEPEVGYVSGCDARKGALEAGTHIVPSRESSERRNTSCTASYQQTSERHDDGQKQQTVFTCSVDFYMYCYIAMRTVKSIQSCTALSHPIPSFNIASRS